MKTRKKLKTFIPALVSAAFLVGCAHEAGKELQDARVAYNQAQQSPARDLAPDKLYEAKQALERAEKVNLEQSGDSAKERDLSYIAHRKADLAVVYGKLEAMQRLREDVPTKALQPTRWTRSSRRWSPMAATRASATARMVHWSSSGSSSRSVRTWC